MGWSSDPLLQRCALLSTGLHILLLAGFTWYASLPPAADEPTTTQPPAPAEAAASPAPSFVAAPAAWPGTRPRLEPTELPPLPQRSLSELLDQAESASPPLPADAEPDRPATAGVREQAEPSPDTSQGLAQTELDLRERYLEFARQMSHRLAWHYQQHWRSWDHKIQGDRLPIRLRIRNSRVVHASLPPGSSSGSPHFDQLLLDFFNRPAAAGTPLNALAVPDAELVLVIGFR